MARKKENTSTSSSRGPAKTKSSRSWLLRQNRLTFCIGLAVVAASVTLFCPTFFSTASHPAHNKSESMAIMQGSNSPSFSIPNIHHIAIDMDLCRPKTHCTDWKTIRDAWDTSDIFSAANEAIEEPTNQWAMPHFDINGDPYHFVARVRNPNTDTFISASLLAPSGHVDFDVKVAQAIASYLHKATTRRGQQFHPTDPRRLPVMLDIGANIGYMTSIGLASGARVISFEPMRVNVGCLLATVRANGWQHRSDVYHNAVSNEPAVVNMKPTNSEINKSNGHVTNSNCRRQEERNETTKKEQYGVDYMEAVTVDQVMREKYMQHNRDDHDSPHDRIRRRRIDRIDVIKIDVETFEVNVMEGMMQTLCHVPIDAMLVEILYIQNHATCNETKMHSILTQLGFGVAWDGQPISQTTPFAELPANVVYVQQNETLGMTPFVYFQKDTNHPCHKVPVF